MVIKGNYVNKLLYYRLKILWSIHFNMIMDKSFRIDSMVLIINIEI